MGFKYTSSTRVPEKRGFAYDVFDLASRVFGSRVDLNYEMEDRPKLLPEKGEASWRLRWPVWSAPS